MGESFVQLNRGFRELDPHVKPEEAALSSYGLDWFLHERGLGWQDILAKTRVVILGESGSGKTREFWERAAALTKEGHVAFFIRLDQIGRQSLTDCLRVEDRGQFLRWKKSRQVAFFFLDSVDEAKFHRISDFYDALDNFRNGLGPQCLSRAKIFLSSRISEWSPLTDPSEFNRRFPISHHGETGRKADNLLVVQIEPLNREQVKRFAEANGVDDVDRFVQALDDTWAWEFARRPLDVLELCSFWNQEHRIGSLTEIIEHDLQSKLKPRQVRDEHPISDAQAWEGAEWLAAASFFARRFSFWVEDDGVTGAEALNFSACLPEHWSPELCRALCNRSLFDAESYGRIRFHHRRVSEYLAARWITARMAAGCPPYELERLLAGNVRGRKLIRPSLRPVAAWLCCGNERWHESVRALVLEAGPEIHLNYGDPSGLALAYKRKILNALALRAKGRRRWSLESWPYCLSRLADPGLASDIAALIQDRSLAVDFRIEMLEIIRNGRLGSCFEAVLKILESPQESEEIKTHAVAAVGSLSDSDCRKRLLQIVNQWPKITNRLCAKIAEVLYPDAISAEQLCGVLLKSEPVKSFSTDLPFYLKRHFEEVVTPALAPDLLKNLLALARTPPLGKGQDEFPVSSRFSWVGDLVLTVLTRVLRRSSLSMAEMELAGEAVWLLGRFRECHELNDKKLSEIDALTHRHPNVRRNFFWRSVSEYRTKKKAEPQMALELFGYWEAVRFSEKDLAWLLEDISTRNSLPDRALALRMALQAWDYGGRKCSTRRRICEVIGDDQALIETFAGAPLTSHLVPTKRIWSRVSRWNIGNKWWWELKIQSLTRRWSWFRGQITLLKNITQLSSGAAVHWLADLLIESANDNSRLGSSDWSNLAKQRGKLVSSAVKLGCKRAWRRFIPPLPHENAEPGKIDHRLIVGLAGLQVLVKEDEMQLSQMSEEDAEFATRYAVNELNGFPNWLETLAASRPQAVGKILCECIQGEWEFPKERERVHEVLARLAMSGEVFDPLIEAKVLELLQVSDPANLLILQFALTILMRRISNCPGRLLQMAKVRVACEDLEKMILWLAVCLQIDGKEGLSSLRNQLKCASNPDEIVVRLCAALSDTRGAPGRPLVLKPDYLRPAILRYFIPMVFEHVRLADDIDRSGAGGFTPTARDDAQIFRGALLGSLQRSEMPDAADVLRDLAGEPALSAVKDWILDLLNQRLEQEADLAPWTPEDLREFAREHEVDPKNDKELFSIACKRLFELRWDVDVADNSLRDELRSGDPEYCFRRWIARKLNERSRKRYSVPQEEEIDQRERPDIRLENPKTDAVSIEVKWAHHWTIEQLLERLENQLVGQYLRAHNSRYGIYVLGVIGAERQWKVSKNGPSVPFGVVVEIIQAQAKSILDQNHKVHGLEVVGIDFRQLDSGAGRP